jgi:hypothetical protein
MAEPEASDFALPTNSCYVFGGGLGQERKKNVEAVSVTVYDGRYLVNVPELDQQGLPTLT